LGWSQKAPGGMLAPLGGRCPGLAWFGPFGASFKKRNTKTYEGVIQGGFWKLPLHGASQYKWNAR
jgi:hypothetical protein